ncbi:MAG TPA: hypothetical protein VM553_16650 [Dongiaceae bacterium]|nr:hypothetical protein [Dongiaceae bacterium]
MKSSNENSLPAGTTEHFANMHKWLQRGLFVCLVALVLEASLSLPGLLIWFGWPTLTVSEVCHELMKVRWSDDKAECLIPHPLYGENEGEGRTTGPDATAQDQWGIQPRPLYKRIGFRDLVKFRDERLEREAAAGIENPQ